MKKNDGETLFIVNKECGECSNQAGVNPAWVSLTEQLLGLVKID